MYICRGRAGGADFKQSTHTQLHTHTHILFSVIYKCTHTFINLHIYIFAGGGASRRSRLQAIDTHAISYTHTHTRQDIYGAGPSNCCTWRNGRGVCVCVYVYVYVCVCVRDRKIARVCVFCVYVFVYGFSNCCCTR